MDTYYDYQMVQALHGCAETIMFLEERRDGDVEQ